MDVERERRVLAHLEDALEWPPAERDARLNEKLAHDPAVLSAVRRLLATANSLGTLLPTELPVPQPPEDAAPPDRLGPYRLGELLGTGGMGRVYRAERVDGVFEHTIAIKLMRRTRLPAQMAEQFARERQILARLQHRNVAQLFDGGVSPDGISYFVMELVEGRPIDRYVQEESLDIRSLLMLFRQVCSAVQYAHARLVVHADIKPNNIVVTRDGTAKLLDFGVARVVADIGDPAAASSGSLGITHFYASPARRAGEVAGTADDVYSLGVLMSELLKTKGSVPAELRSICSCASADEPTVRYASVDAMKADIERWLNGFPVHAHGSSWRYVARKFLARHRLAVVAAGAGVLLLTSAATALAVLYVRAEHARQQAEERFTEVRDLSHYVLFDVYDQLESVPRALRLRHNIAAEGQKYLDLLARDPAAPVSVRLEVAEGLRRLALVEGTAGAPSLALTPRATANLARAESIARALPDDALYARERSLALARIFIARSRVSSAIALDMDATRRWLDAAAAVLAPLLAASPPDAEARGLALELAAQRAAQLQWQGKYVESVRVTRDALNDETPLEEVASPQRSEAVRRHAQLLDILAESTYYAGDVPAAEAPYREQYELLRGLYEEDPSNLRNARVFMRAGWALGATLVELGPTRMAEAEQVLSDALRIADQLRMLEPQDQDLLRMRSIVAAAEGQALAGVGRLAEAVPLLEQAVEQRQAVWDQTSGDWAIARDVASGWIMLGEVLVQAHNSERACASLRNAERVLVRMRTAGRLTKLDEDTTVQELSHLLAAHCESPLVRAR